TQAVAAGTGGGQGGGEGAVKAGQKPSLTDGARLGEQDASSRRCRLRRHASIAKRSGVTGRSRLASAVGAANCAGRRKWSLTAGKALLPHCRKTLLDHTSGRCQQ